MLETRNSLVNAESISPVTENMNTGYSVDFAELFYNLLAGWRIIIVMVLVGALLAYSYVTFIATPMYEATSTIYVLGNKDSAINLTDLQLGTALTQDYVKVFKMWEVHEQVISNLQLPYTYRQMKSMLTITNDTNTRMIDIKVTLDDPKMVATISNEYAKVASQFIADVMATDKPNIVSVALTPVNPVSPNKTLTILTGIVIGGLLACAMIIIKTLMNDTYKTEDEIRRYTGWPTLAIIPAGEESDKGGKNTK